MERNCKSHDQPPVSLNGNEEQLAKIFKLNVFCFEKLFDWLSVTDLRTLRQICKRMNVLIDYYIEFTSRTQRSLQLTQDRLEYLCETKYKGFDFLNQLSISAVKIQTNRIRSISTILEHIESLRISTQFIDGDLHNDLLVFCTHLKQLYLHLHHKDMIIGNKNAWIKQHYPSLELISLNLNSHFREDFDWFPLRSFFKRNTNIHTFSSRLIILWLNRFWIFNSNIRLKHLNVWIIPYSEPEQACKFLKKLHASGFYQKLHLYTVAYNVLEQFPYIQSLDSLEKLSVGYSYSSQNAELGHFLVSPLNSLKELFLGHTWPLLDLKTLAINIPNIRRIFIEVASIDEIIPFIRHCANLRQIKISHLKKGNHFENSIIDLSTLNIERKQLENARKIEFFVEETVYLAHKWTGKLNVSMIELSRAQSCQWD